jgi:asparagine N-glycosylation enzyme membrane subunit Stt3
MTRQQKSGVVLTLLGLATLLVLPSQVESAHSAVYPQVIATLLLVFGLLVTLLASKSEIEKTVALSDPLLLRTLVLVLGAVVLIRFAGFYPTILITLPLFLYLFGERNLRKTIPYALAVTGTIYFLIDYTLGSSLP